MTDSAPAPVHGDSGPPGPDPAPLQLDALVRAGDWRRAAAAARLGAAHPDLQEALSALVDVQDALRARRYPRARRALADYRRALLAAPPETGGLGRQVDPEALHAALGALDGRPPEAEPAALEARLSPALLLPLTRAEALNTLGVLHAQLGDPGLARQHFEQAMIGDPGHYRALTNLGNLELEAGDAPGAEARYRAALKLNPDYDGAHHNLGVALRRQGKVAEAVSAIRRGQRLSMRRSRDDTDAEMREQLALSPVLRTLRWGLLALLAGVILLAVRGLG